MQNKEQHETASYYKKISEVISTCTDVLLFGSTNAKTELHNLLRANHLFNDVKIEVRTTDKLDDNQMQTIVKEYFKTSAQ